MTDRNLYTVGWICAIHTELVAALALLDERHNRPTELDPNDSNNYQLGKISGHYVAIACLPDGEQGIAAAAGAATNLLRSFPNIRFGLMVGTGGGAPTRQNDIRLGDVVVSTPKDGKGGVFQYDFGKTMQDKAFVETGFLDQPPSLLRAAVAGLKADYEMDGHTLTEEVNKALQRKPRLQKTYSRPQTGDILYKSAYTHISGPWEACEACDDDPSNCIPRRPRDENDDDPVIHYGLIASANQRMENAIIRDKIAMDKGVLCFEMEAAGLMNHFPCLIIRGICDYADTHKNNKWRGYASMMAAAYARDLISRLLPDEVQESKTANEILLSLTDHMSELTFNTDKIAHKLDLAKLSIAEGAEYGSYADQHEDECLQGTRTKILHDIEEWATTLSSKCIFWLNGMAGTGKSTISRTIARHFQAKQLLGASFFFKKGEADRGNATRFFSTIASQLQTRIPGMGDQLRKVIDSEPQISTRSLKEQFERLIVGPISCLKAANSQPSFLVVVIDALDECDNDKDIQVLLHLIPQLQVSSSMHFRLFITSRPDLPTRLGFKDMGESYYQDLILHEIPEADIEHDIRFFLNHRLAEVRKSRMLREEWPGEININTLTTISTPLFIFAATMCRVFEDHDLDPQACLDEYLEYKAEDSKLDAIYLPILERIFLNVPNDESQPIRLFHLSFRDFLLHHKTPEKTAIWIDKKATNQKLAMQCLDIMCSSLKRNICNLPNYASIAEENHDYEVSELVDDAMRYILRNERMITEKPLQLYLSGLLFAPAVSAVKRQFSGELPDSISMTQNVDSSWGAELGELQDSEDPTCVALSPTGDLLAAGFPDMTIRVWTTYAGLLFNWWSVGDAVMIQAIAFSPDEKLLASCSSGPGKLQFWDPSKGTLLSTFDEDVDEVRSLVFTDRDDRLLASGDDEGTIIIWDTTTGVQREHIMKHMGPVIDISFSPGGQLLASIHENLIGKTDQSEDEIAVWDLNRYSLTQIFKDKLGMCLLTLFYGDDETLVSIGESIRLWDATDVSPNQRPHEKHVISVVFSFDGQLLATVCHAGSILIWKVTSENIIQNLGDRYNGNILAFSPSNTLLAFSSSPGVVNLWNINTEMQQSTIDASGEIYCVAFSPDDQLVACLVGHQDIKIWDISTQTFKTTIHNSYFYPPINSIGFSPNGQYLASSTLFPHHNPHERLIKGFRLPNTDTADFDFWISDTKLHFSRDDINSIHDFPVFELWTPQGDLDREMVSKRNHERTTDLQNQLVVDGEWLCYKDEKVLWLPDSHRASCWASNNTTVAIGHSSGGVTIIKISPQFGCSES
ncbi:NACHT domain-containing protein [Trichoderma breve]|uniref:NACHT domain-containing protein n=1 Tax=Trichoderma breve TaxID=2034170 RepID=A0A9W9EF48_9HYPO|nr:NACHT domain-containing protein [Trichoderma breve]KAJ4865555.1 NACHT domain-containing protein [Trichoderma breve]